MPYIFKAICVIWGNDRPKFERDHFLRVLETSKKTLEASQPHQWRVVSSLYKNHLGWGGDKQTIQEQNKEWITEVTKNFKTEE